MSAMTASVGGVGRRRRWRGTRAAAMGFSAGFAVGLVAWSVQMRRGRRDLFSRSPLRRLAAIGWLAGDVSVETVRVLHDYLRWETVPTLRRRGEAVLRRAELDLE